MTIVVLIPGSFGATKVETFVTCTILKGSSAVGIDPSYGFKIEMFITKLKCGVPLNALEIFVGIVLPITVLALLIWCFCCCIRSGKQNGVVYIRSPLTAPLV